MDIFSRSCLRWSWLVYQCWPQYWGMESWVRTRDLCYLMKSVLYCRDCAVQWLSLPLCLTLLPLPLPLLPSLPPSLPRSLARSLPPSIPHSLTMFKISWNLRKNVSWLQNSKKGFKKKIFWKTIDITWSCNLTTFLRCLITCHSNVSSRYPWHIGYTWYKFPQDTGILQAKPVQSH